VGYDACRAVIFDRSDPDCLDLAQRQALREYLLGGGALILSAPSADVADPARSWLAPYIPVQIIGRRQIDRLDLQGGIGSLRLRDFVPAAEAFDAFPVGAGSQSDAEVVFRDGHYVHAAVSRVGLGRVVFTSFPINALDSGDQRAAQVWRRLLDFGSTESDGRSMDLGQEQARLLPAMLGRPTQAWSRA